MSQRSWASPGSDAKVFRSRKGGLQLSAHVWPGCLYPTSSFSSLTGLLFVPTVDHCGLATFREQPEECHDSRGRVLRCCTLEVCTPRTGGFWGASRSLLNGRRITTQTVRISHVTEWPVSPEKKSSTFFPSVLSWHQSLVKS